MPGDAKKNTWKNYGNRCVSCNIKDVDLAKIGLTKQIQHTPPYSEVGNDAKFLPFCSWCHSMATSHMMIIKKLLAGTAG